MRNWLARLGFAARPRGPSAAARSLNDRGCAAQGQGDSKGAIALFEQALAASAGWPVAARNLALVHLGVAQALRREGRAPEALEHCAAAVRVFPELAEGHNNLGTAYKDLGRMEEAEASYRRALEIDPALAEAHLNMGMLRVQAGGLDEAEEHFRRALRLRPDSPDALLGVGHCHDLRGENAEAMDCYRRAIATQPDLAEAHFNYALQLLAAGDFGRGWEEYEWRWRLAETQATFPAGPPWDGADPRGRRILVFAEQGFGDALQFIRYAPLLAERGASVFVRCHAELVELFRHAPGVAAVEARDDLLPAYDCWAALMSLPRLFGTGAQAIPANVPYLRADPRRAAAWRERLRPDGARLRIGIAWGSNPRNRIGALKSLRLADFAACGSVPGAVFYSLQKGPASAEAAHPPQGVRLVDLSARLNDFAETAALVENLDAVVSVDTAVAHLAGALGKPVWMLAHYPTVWRWVSADERSPWYPTLRVLKQGPTREWARVLDRLAAELRAL